MELLKFKWLTSIKTLGKWPQNVIFMVSSALKRARRIFRSGSEAFGLISSNLVAYGLKQSCLCDPFFAETTSVGSFNISIEFGMPNLTGYHISFACTGFRTNLKHPRGVH